MSHWLYVFSQFTPEAMLFELTVIFLLIACYCAFWVLRKRKFGSMEHTVPSGVVRGYLNQMINDAQLLRSQLFGLLAGMGGPLPVQAQALQAEPRFSAAAPVAPQTLSDPELKKRLTELESQLSAQKNSLDIVLKEKTELEKALAAAKSQTGGTAPAASDGAELKKLKDQIKELEDRLAEYSVIEDDLANLKRLQQENAKLKALLEQKGGAGTKVETAEPVAATPAPAATPTAPAPQPAAAPAAAAAASATPAAPAAEPAGDEEKAASDALNFEGLVDKVEESLKDSMAAPPDAGTPAKQPEKAGEAPQAQPTGVNQTGADGAPKTNESGEATGKSDEDLISEFEKMLNM